MPHGENLYRRKPSQGQERVSVSYSLYDILAGMIAPEEVKNMILSALPGSQVAVRDMTGGGDHFDILVVSKKFDGKTLIDQHKMVFAALQSEMDRRIHAVQLKTKVS